MLAAIALVLLTQQPKDPPMVSMQLVVLEPGPNKEKLAKAEESALQKKHLEFLQSLADKGVGKAIGPLEGHESWYGLSLLDVKTPELAVEMIQGDPMVASKKLVAKAYTWFFGRHAGLFEKRSGAFIDLEKVTIGFLMRPKASPTYPQKELEEIQAGHMANIRKMNDSGLLVTAGPMQQDTPFRGIFLWRTLDQTKIKEMLKGDTAIQKGRLECKLATWYISKGLIPAK